VWHFGQMISLMGHSFGREHKKANDPL